MAAQDFWRYWNNLLDLTKLPEHSNLRMFKSNIMPTWEDTANKRGGKFVPLHTRPSRPSRVASLIMPFEHPRSSTITGSTTGLVARDTAKTSNSMCAKEAHTLRTRRSDSQCTFICPEGDDADSLEPS